VFVVGGLGWEVVGGSVADWFQEGWGGEDGSELGRDGSFEGAGFTGGGMGEAKPPGMEHEAPGIDGLALGVAVDRVAEERAAEVMEVDADLVSAAGVEVAENEGGEGVGDFTEDVVVCDGGAAGAGVEDGLLLTIDGMAADVSEDGAGGLHRRAVGDGEIELGGFASGKLREKRLQGGIGLGGHEAAGGVLVEAMDDAGALHSADSRELAAAVVEEGVDERAVRIAGGGMDDEADWLVEDDEVVILKENVERDLLRKDCGRFGGGQIDRNGVAPRYRSFGAGNRTIEKDVAALEKALNAGARQFGQLAGEEEVQPFAGIVVDGDPHGGKVRGERGGEQGASGERSGGSSFKFKVQSFRFSVLDSEFPSDHRPLTADH
jgi:hypothetical protein